MDTDKRALVCNYAVPTSIARKGAKAYVCQSPGYPDNVYVLVRSRSGRWVNRWERTKRLTNFRTTTIPPSHPRYADFRIAFDCFDEGEAERLSRWAA